MRGKEASEGGVAGQLDNASATARRLTTMMQILPCYGGIVVAAGAVLWALGVAGEEPSPPPPPGGEALAALGERPPAPDVARAAWDAALKEFGGDASAVPEATLRQLGWALAGAPPDHLRNLSVVDVDTVAALGAAPGLNALQLSALADRIVEDWGSKHPEEYSHLDLAALRRILCGFRPSDLQRLQPDAYREAAPELAGLKNCPKEVLQSLAKLATDSKAFGDPAHWTDTQVRSVGCIIGGLPLYSFSSITIAAMEGMTPQAVPCLTIEQIKSMSPDHFKRLVSSAKSGLTSEQKSALNKEKKLILENEKSRKTQNNKAPCRINIMSYITITVSSILLIVKTIKYS